MIKNKGLTLIETLISVSILAGASLSVLKYQQETIETNKTQLFAQNLDDILNGIDERISVDGYDPDLWDSNSWNDSQITDLIQKELQGIDSSCGTGTWNPVGNDNDLKLVDCDLFEYRAYPLEMNAKITKGTAGFIKEFDIEYNFKNNADFNKHFKSVRNAFRLAKTNAEEKSSGTVYYSMNDLTTGTEVSVTECIDLASQCVFKTTFNRQGGTEYVRADGSNSIIAEHLTFIETKGDSPMKCVRWSNTSRDGSGTWSQVVDEECGVGIYTNDPHPVSVDVVTDTGSFKNVLLDEECKIFEWNGTNVVDSGTTSPCGMTNNGTEIYQVIDNITSENGYFKNVYGDSADFYIMNIDNLTTDTINAKNVDIQNKLKTDLIESYTSGSDITVNSDMTLTQLLNVNGDVTIDGDTIIKGDASVYGTINATSGNINSLNTNYGNIDILNVTLDAQIQSNATFHKDITVKDDAFIKDDLTVTDLTTTKRLNTSSTTNFGGTNNFNGRINANEYLDINKVVSENSSCSHNGLLARTSAGKLLSCTSGKWQSSGSSPTLITVSGSGTAYRWASASASCPTGYTVTGGGGHCYSSIGYMFMPYNRVYGNGWRVSCDTTKSITTYANVYAICIKN